MSAIVTPENLAGSMPINGRRSAAIRRYKALESDRSSWRSHWMELTDYILPRRGRYLMESQNSKGRKRGNKIINNTGGRAVRTMAAGMMSGMTSPVRPWHRRTVTDPELRERGDVRKWLGEVEKIERQILNGSNFYNSIFNMYLELGTFGTSPMYRQKSFDQVIRFRPFTAGEYVIAENSEGIVDTLGRNYTMTVHQVVEQFIYDRITNRFDWSKASKAVKSLWDQKNYDAQVPMIHLIEPRLLAERDLSSPAAKDMPFRNCYFEEGAEKEVMLHEGGYKKFPAYVPRWQVLCGDVYGTCPGMETLPDIKQLQHMEKRKAQGIDKMVNPPMTAPTTMRGKPTTTLPGQTTYVDPVGGSQKFEPTYQVDPRIDHLVRDIERIEAHINSGFYADLFAMMISSDRRQMTATEVVERHEEKLVLLGPVLQRLNVELLNPLLDDVFDYALEAGLLPEPPEVLYEAELGVEYISLLAQAQQAVSASAIERTMGFAGNLAGLMPEVLDNIDADDAIRNYNDIIGGGTSIVRDAEQVDQIRQQRQEEMRQAQEQEALAQNAQAAKVMSETDTQTPNALTELLGRGASV